MQSHIKPYNKSKQAFHFGRTGLIKVFMHDDPVTIHVLYKQVRPSAALASLRGAPRPAVGLGALHLANTSTNTPLVIDYLLVTASHCWKEWASILSLLERASIAVVVVVVGAGEGRSLASLGRPRTILRCNVMLLVMGLSPGPNRMQSVRISALYLE